MQSHQPAERMWVLFAADDARAGRDTRERRDEWDRQLAPLELRFDWLAANPDPSRCEGEEPESECDAVLLDWSDPGSDSPAPMVRARERAGLAPVIVVVPEADHPRSKIAKRLGARAVFARAEVTPEGLLRSIESERMMSELRAARDRARRSATRDSLTGLIDRASFLEALERTLAIRERDSGRAALLLFDLDDFADIESKLGRPAADELLRRVAERTSLATRRGDVAARVGADEFAVLLVHPSDATAPARAAACFLEAMGDSIRIHGAEFRPRASVGIALAPENGARSEEIVRAAERALTDAKECARGRFRYASARVGEATARLLEAEAALARAAENDAPPLVFEAQRDVLGGQVTALHSTLDWSARFPDARAKEFSGWLSPARRAGLLGTLFEWHLRGLSEFAAKTNLALRLDLGRRPIRVSEFVDQAARLAAFEGVERRGFELELGFGARGIAESGWSDEHLAETFETLDAKGVALSLRLDGLAAGVIRALECLPFRSVVLDRERVADVTVEGPGRILVESIAAVARTLGRPLVAEGVDTEAQRDALVELGCAEMRGSLVSKGLSAAATLEWLDEASPADPR